MPNNNKMKSENSSELNHKQKAFCELYVSKTEFFANGVQSYIEAYGIDVSKKGSYAAARVSVSRLLTNANILDHIDHLIEMKGLNDQFVDKQLEFLITQNADLSIKLGAIKEYNKLKTRITQKMDVSVNEQRDYSSLSPNDLKRIIDLNKKALVKEKP